MENSLPDIMEYFAEHIIGHQWVSAEERLPEEDGLYYVFPHHKGYECPDPVYFTKNGKSVDKGFPDGPTWYYGDPESMHYCDPEPPYYTSAYEYWCKGTMYWNKCPHKIAEVRTRKT